ncbi:BGTF surface domain-containing protein [Haloferax namakaokahaiae]|uniref:BGTF surface domain-containing protein n=1 Tax=Haloferax namakaokahaiae TaxID=1748331 RepID=A0ABD5ZAR9_9EURY
MTRNKQIRAVLLAALMVFSVFAGSIAFTGTAAADPSAVDASQSGSTLTVNATLDGDEANATAFVDVDGDGALDGSEPSTTNNSLGGATSLSETLDVSDVNGGTYTIFVYTNDSIVNNSTTSFAISDSEAPEIDSVVHYDNDTSNDEAVIELVIDEQFDTGITASDFALYQDGEEVNNAITNVNYGADGQLILETSAVVTGDVELNVGSDVTDVSGNELDGLDDDGNVSVTVATVTANGNSPNAYQGEIVAITDNATDTTVDIESDDTQDDSENYQFSGSTGTNSQVFVFDTSNRELETYNYTVGSSSGQIDVTDLGLEISVDDLNVTTEDTIEGTVSANAGGRTIDIAVLDDDDEEVATIEDASLNGQGEYEFSFDVADEDIDAGDYTVEVTDTGSSVTATSDTVTVSEAEEGSADFNESVVTDERGDVVAIPVLLENADTATLSIGTSDQGYAANVTVEDGNDDGEVVVLWNSAESTSTNVNDVFDVEDSDDEILTGDDGQTEVTENTSDLIDAGDYDLEVQTGTSAGNAENVATLVLEEGGVENVRTWTAPDAESVSDLDEVSEALENGNLTEDSEIAFGDKVVIQIEAAGLEGTVDPEGDETVSNFFDSGSYQLTVNQSNPGPNRDPKILNLTNATVIADGSNDTYFVVYNSEDVEAVRDTNDNGVIDSGETNSVDVADDDQFDVEFKMFEDPDSGVALVDEDSSASTSYENVEAEHDFDSDPVNVTNTADVTISGTSNTAPGTEITLRVRSSGDTQPRFLKTATVYVTENGTFTGTFDFSEQAVDDTFTVTADGGVAPDVEVDGNVVESVETETTATETTTTAEETTTTTAEETTTTAAEETTTTAAEETTTDGGEGETSTGTPGFGVAVALVALVAAALLAIRRD